MTRAVAEWNQGSTLPERYITWSQVATTAMGIEVIDKWLAAWTTSSRERHSAFPQLCRNTYPVSPL